MLTTLEELTGVLTEEQSLFGTLFAEDEISGEITVGVIHEGGSPGVSSWNTRIGHVAPQQDDYTLGMVGGIPLTNTDIDELWNSL